MFWGTGLGGGLLGLGAKAMQDLKGSGLTVDHYYPDRSPEGEVEMAKIEIEASPDTDAANGSTPDDRPNAGGSAR